MRPINLKCGPYAAGSVTVLAASQAPTAGTALTLAATALDTPRRVLLTFGADAVVTRSFVLVGTGWSLMPQSETLVIPTGAGTIVSALDYAAIVSATPTGTGWSANVSLGTSTTGTNSPLGSSAWARLDDYGFSTVSLGLVVTGTASVTVELSDDNPNLALPQVAVVPSAMTWISHPVLTNQSQSAISDIATKPLFVRLTANTATATTGSATLAVVQSGGKFG